MKKTYTIDCTKSQEDILKQIAEISKELNKKNSNWFQRIIEKIRNLFK